MELDETGRGEALRSLVVVCSYHHKNTEKVARAIVEVLGAPVKTPQEVGPDEIAAYDLVGFGSGIYHATFHPSLLDLAGRLPRADGRRAFLFSTYGAPAVAAGDKFVSKNHSRMREALLAKGYAVVGEFACAGWNTNVFLKYFGGLNRGHPDAGDLGRAAAFARSLVESAR
ncbi:MAG: flavodoxin [Methanospirillum sp.]|nr:flavodoxin [Methanospirillum sp.]